MKISVVIPSYNGWDCLEELCKKIKKHLLLDYNLEDFEIIIVDDGSYQRSDILILNLRSLGIDIKGIFLKNNYGQQFATLAGLRVSKGEYILTIDDDLSHNPDDFSELLLLIQKDEFDVVFGIPEKSRTGLLRRGGSVLRDLIFKVFFSMPKKLTVSSFRILNRSLVNKIIGDISEYRYLSVEILKHTKVIGNLKVNYDREPGIPGRYSFIKLAYLAFSLIRCSKVFPVIIRRSKTALKMEWDII